MDEQLYDSVHLLDDGHGRGGDTPGGGDMEATADSNGGEAGTADKQESLSSRRDESAWQSLWSLLNRPVVSILMLSYFVISFNAIIYDEVLPLWALSSVEKGGLGYQSSDVGQVMSLVGVPVVIFTFLGYPPLAKAFAEPYCFRMGQLVGGVACFITVLLRYLFPVLGGEDAVNNDNSSAKWTLQILLVVLSSVCHIGYVTGFTSLFLLINRSVHTDRRATVNGLAMTIGSVAKAVGPILGSVMYAWSIENNLREPMNFMLVFAMCLFFSVLMLAVPRHYFEQGAQPQGNGAVVDEQAPVGSSPGGGEVEGAGGVEMLGRGEQHQQRPSSSWGILRFLPTIASDKKNLLHNMDCSDDEMEDEENRSF